MHSYDNQEFNSQLFINEKYSVISRNDISLFLKRKSYKISDILKGLFTVKKNFGHFKIILLLLRSLRTEQLYTVLL